LPIYEYYLGCNQFFLSCVPFLWFQGITICLHRSQDSRESTEATGLGGGLQEETGDRRRPGLGGNVEITLGDSWGGMLGWPGNRVLMGRKAGDAHRRQDLKMSQR
jgi:hypothetical protein